MKFFPRHALVRVTWGDAWNAAQEEYDEAELLERHKPWVTYSAGFVVRHDRTGIMLAGDYDERTDGKQYDRVAFIPAGMILSVRKA